VKGIRFAVVTVMTGFGMTSTDSGANNLADLTPDPEFAGTCGFSAREYGGPFRDRTGEVLQALKSKRRIELDYYEDDLRREILDWRGVYGWLGDERIPSLYSIPLFFRVKPFVPYWAISGGPSHLKALMRERLQSPVRTRLEGYRSDTIRKADLGKLGAAATPFHSGHLTIDGARLPSTAPAGDRKDLFCWFRPPDREAGNSYGGHLCDTVFGAGPEEFCRTEEDLRDAVIREDSGRIAKILRGMLSGAAHMRHDFTPGFHRGFVHVAFRVSGLTVSGEVAGTDGSSDMAVFLPSTKRPLSG
jgi:hypothetical protein